MSIVGYMVSAIFLHLSYQRYFWLLLAFGERVGCGRALADGGPALSNNFQHNLLRGRCTIAVALCYQVNVMVVIELVFWTSALLLAYVCVGFPAMLWLRYKLFNKPAYRSSDNAGTNHCNRRTQ